MIQNAFNKVRLSEITLEILKPLVLNWHILNSKNKTNRNYKQKIIYTYAYEIEGHETEPPPNKQFLLLCNMERSGTLENLSLIHI